MSKLSLLIAFFILLSFNSFTQWTQQSRDSLNRLSNEDHQLMMKMLGINALRPGPSGNPQDPNAANADESKANQYSTLPDPLVFKNGEPVTTPKQWDKRKKEIFEEFDREVYGRVPKNVPKVTWKVISVKDTMNGIYPVRIKQLEGEVDNSSCPEIKVSIHAVLTTPGNVSTPVPVIMEFGWIFPGNWKMPPQNGPTWQEQLLAVGWGYAILIPTSYQADNGAGLRQGIIGLVNKGQARKLDDWGALRAWAWGASRTMDYFETDKDVDAKRIGIEGLSRYGKAAIVTLAYDKRFAIGLIGSSGAGGAKLLRHVFGEQVENLASSSEYHWFAPNFIKYAGPLSPGDLPVDAHELVALCAPRPVYISAGSNQVEGNWIDSKGMFLAAVHAGPVYKLLGKKDLGTVDFPPQETGLTEGEIAFRQHAGGHTVEPNWPSFILFAGRYLSK